MKSRITIEVDFDNGNIPVIQIIDRNSDDVRDRLIATFLQNLQHTSRWCKILFVDNIDNTSRRWKIVPITPNEIEEEMKLMKAVCIVNNSDHE